MTQISRTSITVRYAETDQTGLVAHAKFVPWFELGRADLLKLYGFDYRDFERRGYYLPVLELGLEYHQPARYDDVLSVETSLKARHGFRIRIEYRVTRAIDVLIASGFSVQGFV